MADCNHNCSSCGQDCSDRTEQSMLAPLRPECKVKKVIGVVSGKGGVGKSLVTSLLACAYQRAGQRVAVLDADILGPSIPQCFGQHKVAMVKDEALLPIVSDTGIQMMSINLVLDDETQPVLFRGPVIGGTVKQFWSDVLWDDVDIMFVDMPPGTGDVALTVFQSLPVDGIVIVTSPQELVGMIVKKAVNMARTMDIPVLGIVENMSYFTCPDCGKQHNIFGESKVDRIALEYAIPNVVKLPIDANISRLCDEGRIEQFEAEWLKELAQVIEP